MGLGGVLGVYEENGVPGLQGEGGELGELRGRAELGVGMKLEGGCLEGDFSKT